MPVLGGVQIRWLALLTSPAVLLAPVLWSRLKEYRSSGASSHLHGSGAGSARRRLP
jgi:hypothetical protein